MLCFLTLFMVLNQIQDTQISIKMQYLVVSIVIRSSNAQTRDNISYAI